MESLLFHLGINYALLMTMKVKFETYQLYLLLVKILVLVLLKKKILGRKMNMFENSMYGFWVFFDMYFNNWLNFGSSRSRLEIPDDTSLSADHYGLFPR